MRDFLLDKKRQIDDLEDRILLRSLDSYGRDVGILRSKILPVFGSQRRRNADQIRSRWHYLTPKKQQKPLATKSWHAQTVASLPVHEQKLAADNAGDQDEKLNLRRSRREIRARVPDDL